MMPFVCERTCI